MTGPQFFRLAWRISAYEGVMTMRLRAQQERSSPAPSSASRYTDPAPATAPTAAPVAEHHEVSLDQFCLMFPGTVSRTVVSASG